MVTLIVILQNELVQAEASMERSQLLDTGSKFKGHQGKSRQHQEETSNDHAQQQNPPTGGTTTGSSTIKTCRYSVYFDKDDHLYEIETTTIRKTTRNDNLPEITDAMNNEPGQGIRKGSC